MATVGRKNRRTKEFKKQFDKLPEKIQRISEELYKTFCDDPFHPILENHEPYPSKSGRHLPGTHAVSITRRYRALYVVDDESDTNVWYWIGSHEDYNNFIGSK